MNNLITLLEFQSHENKTKNNPNFKNETLFQKVTTQSVFDSFLESAERNDV